MPRWAMEVLVALVFGGLLGLLVGGLMGIWINAEMAPIIAQMDALAIEIEETVKLLQEID